MADRLAYFAIGAFLMLSALAVIAMYNPTQSVAPTNAFSKVIDNGGTYEANSYNDVLYLDYAYAQISDLTTQQCAPNGIATNITLDTNDEIHKIAHPTNASTDEITIQDAGIYQIIASPQVGEAVNPADGIYNMWLEKNGVPVENTNVKVHIEQPATHTETVVIPMNFVGHLSPNDILAFGMACTDANIGIIATPTTAVEPATPSIIISIARIS